MPSFDSVFVAYETAKENTIKGDFIDRLHSKITVGFLFVICILIGFKQFDETQIMCWLPSQFTDEQADYSHQFCWINNTYYYPDVVDADLFPESYKHTLLYYQYILFILFGQALLFYLPTMTWNLLARNSVGYIQKILDQCQKSYVPKELPARKPNRPPEKNEPELQKNTERSEKTLNTSVPNIVDITASEKPTDVETDADEAFDPLLVDKKLCDEFMCNFKSIVTNENEQASAQAQDGPEPVQKQVQVGGLASRMHDQEESLDKNEDLEEEKGGFRNISGFLKNTFGRKNDRSKSSKVLNFMKPRKGVEHLAFHYLFLKWLNLLNVVLQMVLLHFMFGQRFFSYGVDFFVSLSNNENPFLMTTQFPVMTFCDFFIYQNLRRLYYNTVQCVLPINVLIEKFFLLIWFWYYFLIVLTVINILTWIVEMIPHLEIEFLAKYLNIRRKMEHSRRMRSANANKRPPKSLDDLSNDEIEPFYKMHFGRDGVVMLHLIKSVAGEIIFMDLLGLLWLDYQDEQKKQQKKIA